ncbi:MAG TPA: hypothetical protein VKY74_07750 [Chloroflexia bacterium]|nr:hypothetical protein [Chloroflexia bacterium]
MRHLVAWTLLLLLAATAVGCDASTANIQSADLAHDFKDGKAVNPATTFGPNDTIHCVVQLANAPDDTKVKAVWTAVDAANGQVKDQKIDETELATGSAPLNFSLAPSKPFPVGKYKVDLYLNGALNKTLTFDVQ